MLAPGLAVLIQASQKMQLSDSWSDDDACLYPNQHLRNTGMLWALASEEQEPPGVAGCPEKSAAPAGKLSPNYLNRADYHCSFGKFDPDLSVDTQGFKMCGVWESNLDARNRGFRGSEVLAHNG